MTGGCDLIRVSLGAYAVDALDPAERKHVEAHLEGCADCTGELAQLRDVAGLLRCVPLRELKRVGLVAADEPASGANERVQRSRRAREWHWAAALAAVAALVAGVIALGSLRAGHHSGYEPTPLIASGADRTTRVFARVTLRGHAWGTAARLSLRGVRPHLQCRLLVLGVNGAREMVATYRTDNDGTADLTTRTAIPITAIASLEVLAGRHQQLVQIPVHGSRSSA